MATIATEAKRGRGALPSGTWAWMIERRRAAGWSQGDLAARLLCEQSMISRWEHGECVPSAIMAARLSEAFGVPVESVIAEVKIFFSSGV